MNVKNFIDFSKPFIDATKNTFEKMVFTKLNSGKPEIKKDRVARGEISAIIGISGLKKEDGKQSKFRGMILVSFPTDVYIKIANAMLGESYTEYNDEIKDVGAEIINIVVGGAKATLNEFGLYPEMATPTTVQGVNHSISYLDKADVILIPFTSDLGQFFMEICYSDI